MSRGVSFAIPFSIALAAVLSLAGAPALGGQVCRPAPADTSSTGYEMAANKCCEPYGRQFRERHMPRRNH